MASRGTPVFDDNRIWKQAYNSRAVFRSSALHRMAVLILAPQANYTAAIRLLFPWMRKLQRNVARGDDCVDVNSDSVPHAPRIPARQRGRYRDPPAARMFEHQPVALLQTFDRQRQS